MEALIEVGYDPSGRCSRRRASIRSSGSRSARCGIARGWRRRLVSCAVRVPVDGAACNQGGCHLRSSLRPRGCGSCSDASARCCAGSAVSRGSSGRRADRWGFACRARSHSDAPGSRRLTMDPRRTAEEEPARVVSAARGHARLTGGASGAAARSRSHPRPLSCGPCQLTTRQGGQARRHRGDERSGCRRRRPSQREFSHRRRRRMFGLQLSRLLEEGSCTVSGSSMRGATRNVWPAAWPEMGVESVLEVVYSPVGTRGGAASDAGPVGGRDGLVA